MTERSTSALEDERLDLTDQLGEVRSDLAAVNAEMRQIRTYKPKGGRAMIAEAEERRRQLVAKQADLEADLASVKQEIRERTNPLGYDDPRREAIRLLQTMANDYELVPMPIAKELRELVHDVDDVSTDLRAWAEHR